jgi:hypothetical protein
VPQRCRKQPTETDNRGYSRDIRQPLSCLRTVAGDREIDLACGGRFPSERFAAFPAAAIASRGTEEASTSSEIQFVRRPPAAITPFCIMTCDLAGPPASSGRDTPGNKIN